jgi:hypothetical protein
LVLLRIIYGVLIYLDGLSWKKGHSETLIWLHLNRKIILNSLLGLVRLQERIVLRIVWILMLILLILIYRKLLLIILISLIRLKKARNNPLLLLKRVRNHILLVIWDLLLPLSRKKVWNLILQLTKIALVVSLRLLLLLLDDRLNRLDLRGFTWTLHTNY